MPSIASVFSSKLSSPSKIPVMYEPKTPSSVLRACSLFPNQVENSSAAAAMFGYPVPYTAAQYRVNIKVVASAKLSFSVDGFTK